jgi:hypothetical protein
MSSTSLPRRERLRPVSRETLLSDMPSMSPETAAAWVSIDVRLMVTCLRCV